MQMASSNLWRQKLLKSLMEKEEDIATVMAD